MTVTFDLPAPVEHAYRKLAEIKGVPLDTLLRELVIAAQPTGQTDQSEPENAAAWIREFKAWTASHSGLDLPLLTDEAISREFIYRERGL